MYAILIIKLYTCIYHLFLPNVYYQYNGNIYSRESEANTSEFLENFEDMFPWFKSVTSE